MRKKTFWVIGILLFSLVVVTLISTLPLESRIQGGSGTCCPQNEATCYVEGYPPQQYSYYKSNGPC